MKTDISSREDIQLILSEFYKKLLNNQKMFPFFKEIVAKNTLQQHLKISADFWHDILFQTNTYKNNTLQKHLDKNAFMPFKKENFTIWISYFSTTIDALFYGEKARTMKNRAISIATVMQLKMKVYEK